MSSYLGSKSKPTHGAMEIIITLRFSYEPKPQWHCFGGSMAPALSQASMETPPLGLKKKDNKEKEAVSYILS